MVDRSDLELQRELSERVEQNRRVHEALDRAPMTVARLVADTNAAIDALPLDAYGLGRRYPQEVPSTPPDVSLWVRARWVWIEVRHRARHAWDALCGRECA